MTRPVRKLLAQDPVGIGEPCTNMPAVHSSLMVNKWHALHEAAGHLQRFVTPLEHL